MTVQEAARVKSPSPGLLQAYASSSSCESSSAMRGGSLDLTQVGKQPDQECYSYVVSTTDSAVRAASVSPQLGSQGKERGTLWKRI